MTDITVCKVLNKLIEREQEFTICSEWSDCDLNIIIIRKNEPSLQGKTALKTFERYAKTFDKSLDTYLQETRDILSGKSNDVEFHLKDDKKFFWKKKNWALGQVVVEPVTDIEHLTRITLELANHYSTLKRNTLELEEDCMKFKSLNSKLTKTLDDIIVKKNEMEETLYKRFILLLNTKKAKIKELRNRLECLKNEEESIFDAQTDDSDCENVPKKYCHSSPNEPSRKRTNSHGEISNIQKRKKEEATSKKSNEDLAEDKSTNVKATSSTSKLRSKTNLKGDDENPDLLSDESICELKLQMEDDKIESQISTKKMSAIHDQSSEEMF